MKIDDKITRTVRLELSFEDIIKIFVDKTGMGDIDNFKWTLISEDGDRELNVEIKGIAMIADYLENK